MDFRIRTASTFRAFATSGKTVRVTQGECSVCRLTEGIAGIVRRPTYVSKSERLLQTGLPLRDA